MTLALAGCAKPTDTDPTMTGAIAQPGDAGRFREGRRLLGRALRSATTKRRDVALNYAAALQRTDRTDQAVAVLQKTTINFPEDRDVLAAYGKALAANGDLQQALETIQRAQTPDKPDWRLMSAEAAILDQIGQNDEARKLYAQALELAPNEPTILSNYAHVVRADRRARAKPRSCCARRSRRPAPTAASARTLRWSSACRGASTRREKIAGAELSPEQAAANVAYLKQMLYAAEQLADS